MPKDKNFDAFGYFLPTTSLWDVNPLGSSEFSAQSVGELVLRLHQQMNSMALAINAKDTGFYVLEEFAPGQQWFSNPLDPERRHKSRVMRQVFRKVIDFGALPNNATKSVPHEIDVATGVTGTKWTRIYGAATNTANGTGIPIPHADQAALSRNIRIVVDDTNVHVTTGSDRTAFDHTVIVLEYLQQ
jgi:hypothetical protein